MRFYDWLMLAAILVAPIVAVQVQKRLEVIRERRQRRLNVFYALMATRSARVSVAHVEALNRIDLEFYGESLFGAPRQSRSYKTVRDAWALYRDHLNRPGLPGETAQWFFRGDDLFIDLLHAMSDSLGFDFQKAHLKSAVYSPQARADEEQLDRRLKQGLAEVVTGVKPIMIQSTVGPSSTPGPPAGGGV